MKAGLSRLCYSVLCISSLLVTFESCAQGGPEAYKTPQAFHDLFYDFTGKGDKNFPKGKINISQLLYEAELARNPDLIQENAPLVMFINSTLYVYDNKGKRQMAFLMRTAPDSGFTEMTAISHIGPALAYLVKAKEYGSDAWKSGLESLLKDIKAVKTINAQQADNWLNKINAPVWKPYLPAIRNMVDYACSMSGNYISDVLSGKKAFTMASLQGDFLEGNKEYPIPYNTIMVATFMLTAYQSTTEIHEQIEKLNIDWPKAKVIIRFVAGSNVTAGVSAGSNWLVPFVKALSNNTLPDDRIFIAPYAEVRPTLGQNELSREDYTYYNRVWTSVFNRTHVAKDVFTTIPSINLPGRPPMPGDYPFSKANAINDFLIRLKYSLSEPTEMLSNTVAFWVSGELAAKHWDISKVAIPGLTTGLPKGINTYPENNPGIK
ncbi:hypothetical protein AQUSIP_08410 [Aquicella siphonis]|uniref:DUF5624 domain-containing protein n=1 Tax=Aquicella siphonis TaxID=254247 RepID=A0A5E4PGV8_9COXI|nr:DUF5624 domain-containing protein [Aquicella siphonis]VVC75551.1 hypothetical protein AQUSIP_08410 [Aquicella siphonis]